MTQMIMPKATAVWLIDNTTLTFNQIADFTGLHHLEIQAIADGEIANNIIGKSPVLKGLVTEDEIKKAEADETYSLTQTEADVPQPKRRGKGPKYTSVTKRADKPDGIAYLIKQYPELTDADIIRLIGTTRKTIGKIRDRSHYKISSIKPRDPVILGLCKRTEMDAALEKARKRAEQKKAKKSKKKSKTKAKKSKNKSAKSKTTAKKTKQSTKKQPTETEQNESEEIEKSAQSA